MKIILTGSTGFIGTEILHQCLAHTYISHIYVLTRRPLSPRFTHPKITQLLHPDFETYPSALLTRLREQEGGGVEACIWAVGGSVPQFRTLDDARRVNIDYAVAGAEAFARDLATGLMPHEGYPEREPRAGVRRFPFRFVYLSCWGAEEVQFKRLWVFADTRKVKGMAEKGIMEVAGNSEVVGGFRCFEAICLRPGKVLAGGGEKMGTVIAWVAISMDVSRG